MYLLSIFGITELYIIVIVYPKNVKKEECPKIFQEETKGILIMMAGKWKKLAVAGLTAGTVIAGITQK